MSKLTRFAILLIVYSNSSVLCGEDPPIVHVYSGKQLASQLKALRSYTTDLYNLGDRLSTYRILEGSLLTLRAVMGPHTAKEIDQEIAYVRSLSFLDDKGRYLLKVVARFQARLETEKNLESSLQ